MVSGRETYESVRMSGPKQEWSFGFFVEERDDVEIKDETYMRFTKLDVKEVSPVWLGAGVNTETLDIRSTNNTANENVIDNRRGVDWLESLGVNVIDTSDCKTGPERVNKIVDALIAADEDRQSDDDEVRRLRSDNAYMRTRLMLAGIEVPDETN